MKKHLVLAIAALSIATSAWAAMETGEVIATDSGANTFTIQTDSGNRIVFHTASDTTRMMRDQTVVALADLANGTRVRVTADEAIGTAPRHASNVEFIDVDAEPADLAANQAEADRQARIDQAEADRLAMNDRLPATASPLPLIALLGSGSMLAGLALRKLRR